MIWKKALQPHPIIPSVLEYVWKVSAEHLIAELNTLPPDPTACEHIVNCNCASKCAMQLSQVKYDVQMQLQMPNKCPNICMNMLGLFGECFTYLISDLCRTIQNNILLYLIILILKKWPPIIQWPPIIHKVLCLFYYM